MDTINISNMAQEFRDKKQEEDPDNPFTKTSIKMQKVSPHFYSPGLIWQIHIELDKTHKVDHCEKLAVFLVGVSAELKDPRDHCSAALKGDSASGKDSAMDTALSHFPEEDNFKLTRGTAPALEEEANKVKRIAFSEMNRGRDNGANAGITETFKQLAEGGVCVLKKDSATGFQTTIKIESEQKTLFYGTTETERDDELETRYVVIPIKGYSEKNKLVIDDVGRKARNVAYYLNRTKNKESWIASSIRNLEHDIQVIIPFTEVFENKILDEDGKEKYIFDYRKERIKRDVKRLYSLTRAIAWLYQKQRVIVGIDGCRFLYAEPDDFLLALKIFASFFNLTYSGLDHRLQLCYETIKSLQKQHDGEIMAMGYGNEYDGWVLRHKLQEVLGIQSRTTIKKRIKGLMDFQLIETHYDFSIPRGYLVRDIGYQEGVNRLSLPVSIIAIDKQLTPYLTSLDCYKNKEIKRIDFTYIDLLLKSPFSSHSDVKSDTLTIDALNLHKDTHKNQNQSTKGGKE